ncbi:hypothetical protein FQA47_001043 [Oryzias melastigma]|uniref:Uncharacterized protein n=1 Tax=Oryzias melastigma TaxID=30732 RepID=A0A834KZ29_ORYME|nr:hypothetical protein FQA47_001043 [Oryzias melastigma]
MVVSAEFKRITTIPLLPKFFSALDNHSANLMKAFSKKGGEPGRKIRTIIAAITKDTEDSEIASAETVIGISVILHEGAEPGENVENVSIILEGI